MNNNLIYNKAINVWGSKSQTDMAIEECAEFIQAVNKLRRAKSDEVNEKITALCGEIADVTIMMEQMSVLFGIDQVEAIKKVKLERLEQRLK